MRNNVRAFFLGILVTTTLLAVVSFGNVKDNVFPGVDTDMKDVKCVKINPAVMRCRDTHATCYVYWEKGVSCVSRSFESITD